MNIAVLLDEDAFDSILRVLQRNAAVPQVGRDLVLLSMRSERLPHLAGPETWIPEFFDEGGYVLTPETEDRHDRPAEREVPDALGGP